MNQMKRWRGLAKLVVDAVEHGSAAVERVQMETARRPFVILEHIPPIADAARGVHVVHDVAVSSVYTIIRRVNGIAGKTIDAVLQVVEAATEAAEARDDVDASIPDREARREPE